MTLDAVIMLSGAFIAVLPFLGFPNSIDRILFLVAGVLVIGLGIIVRRRSIGHSRQRNSIAFTESIPSPMSDIRTSVSHEEA